MIKIRMMITKAPRHLDSRPAGPGDLDRGQAGLVLQEKRRRRL